MFQNPWDNDPVSSGSQSGLEIVVPKTPSPQTPAQAEGDVLGNQSKRSGIADTAFDNKRAMRDDFASQTAVKNYTTALGEFGKMMRAPDDAQGDLSIIYGFAKVQDPGSVVREGEMGMAMSTASLPQELQALVGQINQGKRLPPEVRKGLVEAAREAVAASNQTYTLTRQQYADLAKRSNFDPTEIIGPHPGDAFRSQEEALLGRNVVGPEDAQQKQQVLPDAPLGKPGYDEISFASDGRSKLEKDENAVARQFQARIDRGDSIEQINAWWQSIGRGTLSAEDARTITEARKKGQPIMAVARDLLTPEEKSEVDKRVNEAGTIDRIGSGTAETLTLGTSNKIIAAGRDLAGKGEYDRELLKANAVTKKIAEQSPWLHYGGQVFGGFALPMGAARTPSAIAKVSAAYGGAYGLGKSDSLAEVPGNVATGGLSGLALGYALPKGFDLARAARTRWSGGPKEVPPLVDPVTGRLNEPLEAAGPAARVGMARAYGIDMPMGAAGDRTAAILEKGLDVMPGSAGVTNDARRVLEGQVNDAVEDVASKFGSSKTLNEGGSELQRGMNEWMDRADRIAISVYRKVPINPLDKTVNDNTVAFLKEATQRFKSNPNLAEELRDPTLARYLNALGSKPLSWEDLTAFRTFIGRKIGEFRFSQDARMDDYRALYGALSEDMRATAAQKGEKALKAFERANSFYAAKERRIDEALVRLLGDDAKARPELAAAAVQAMTKGGKSTGDLKKLLDVKASTVKSGAWDEIAGTLIRMGGQPASSPGRQFDPKVFVQWYADMAEPARAALFKPAMRKALDEFVQVNQRLAGNNALRNTSNSAPGITAAGTVGTIGAMLLNPLLGVKLAAVGGANYGMAKLWTNPGFVRWATGYSRAVASGNMEAATSRVGRLSEIASTNPALREEINQLQRALLQSANDNVTPGLAAEDGDKQDDR